MCAISQMFMRQFLDFFQFKGCLHLITLGFLMDANFPILDTGACPKCSKKPCQAFAKAYTKSVVLVGTNEVPINCPLKVSQHELGRFSIGLSDITMAEVNRARSNNGRSFGSNRFNQYTSPKEIILALSIRGEISILGAIYGSPANRQLTAWATAKTSLYRKVVEEKLEAEAAEVEKEKVKPRLFNPTWVWLADPKKPDCEEKSISEGTLYDSVWCKVDTEGLMPSDGVTYAIFLKAAAGGEDTKLTTLSGRVGEGRRDNAAVAGWMFEAKYAGKSLALDKDELYFIARRQSDNLEVTSGKIKVGPQKGDCAEVHDSLFDHNSALMALSPVGAADAFEALNILADALIYATDHEDRECLIYGHADTTGDAAYNVEISKLRAQSVRALLDGKKEDWVSIALKKGSNESLEKYLLAFHHAFGWECDPGIVDGTFSAATKAAVENFQSSFNGEHDGHLEVDGNMGRESWGAVFHILEEQLGLLVEAKGRDPKKLRMRYAAQDGGIVACGEKYPVDAKEKDGFKSQKNRRVEIAFVNTARGVPKTRREILLAPIEIRAGNVKVKEKATSSITGITLTCGHETQIESLRSDKKETFNRKVKQGQVLEIVADIARGDKITLDAEGPGANDCEWITEGWDENKGSGKSFSISAKGVKRPAEQLWIPHFKPHVIKVKANGKDGKELTAEVHAYPAEQSQVKIDFKKLHKIIFEAQKVLKDLIKIRTVAVI
jgi:outer membrane protein OmpA-like peptidoglycan-associated protein